MADIDAPIPAPVPTGPTPVVGMEITLLSDGNVSVRGPLDRMDLVLTMLSGALKAMAGLKSKQEGSRLVQAAPESALRLLNGR